MLFAKASGERPEVSWGQTLVQIAPEAWRPEIRATLLKVVETLQATAVAPEAWTRALTPPELQGRRFAPAFLFNGPTACMRNLDVHLSSLEAGERPHPAHRHDDEELIIPLSGTIEVLRGDEGRQTSETAAPGQLVYHSSGAPHTIRAGEVDAFYLVFKWIGEETQGGGPPLEAGAYWYATEEEGLGGRGPGFGFEPIFEAPTRFLSRLHAHVSRVEPDAGYPDERDPYDIAMVLLSGSIVTQGGRVDAPAVILHPADALHGVRGAGTAAARYLVLEFHGHAELEAR